MPTARSGPAPTPLARRADAPQNVFDRGQEDRLPISRLRFACFLLLIWAATLGCAELALRLLGFAPAAPPAASAQVDKFRPDAELVWSLKPDWAGVEPNGARVRTNRLGLRGPEARDRPAARILFLGDSVVFGHHLEEGSTVPARLQAELGGAAPGAGPEVLNAGVPGYSTFQSERYYRERGRLLGPELVLLGFCLNDVTERYNWLAGYGGAAFFMGGVDTRVGMAWPRRLWHATALRGSLWAALRRAGLRGERHRVSQLWEEPGAPQVVEAWRRVLGELDGLAEAAGSSGARLVVVLFPYARQLRDPGVGATPQQPLLAHLRKRSIPALDLLIPLREAGEPVEALFLDRNHLSARGAERAAGAVAAFLRKEQLLPASAAAGGAPGA